MHSARWYQVVDELFRLRFDELTRRTRQSLSTTRQVTETLAEDV